MQSIYSFIKFKVYCINGMNSNTTECGTYFYKFLTLGIMQKCTRSWLSYHSNDVFLSPFVTLILLAILMNIKEVVKYSSDKLFSIFLRILSLKFKLPLHMELLLHLYLFVTVNRSSRENCNFNIRKQC